MSYIPTTTNLHTTNQANHFKNTTPSSSSQLNQKSLFNPYASPTTPSPFKKINNVPEFIPSNAGPYMTPPPPLKNISIHPSPDHTGPFKSPLSNHQSFNASLINPNRDPSSINPPTPITFNYNYDLYYPNSDLFHAYDSPNHLYFNKSHTNENVPSKGEPDACLFVASLNAQKTDDQLTESVSRHFSRWGPLMNVKVMKDWMNRPYAFVQYRSISHAIHALEESNDTVVDGRHVRVEPARVNRTLFLIKLPKTMSQTILYQYLSKWGGVEDVTMLVNQSTGKPKGCAFAKFRYREDAIRAYLQIRQQGRWGVEWASNLDKNRPETDRHSVFVGQLNPNAVTELALRNRFEQYGSIEHVHLMIAEGEAFAFIRWDDEESASLAIKNEHGQEFQGHSIICQYRETPEQKAPTVRRPLGRSPKPLTRPPNNKLAYTAPSIYPRSTQDMGQYPNHPTYYPSRPNIYQHPSHHGQIVNPTPHPKSMYMGYPPGQTYYHQSYTPNRENYQNPSQQPTHNAGPYRPQAPYLLQPHMVNQYQYPHVTNGPPQEGSQLGSGDGNDINEWNDFEQEFANTFGLLQPTDYASAKPQMQIPRSMTGNYPKQQEIQNQLPTKRNNPNLHISASPVSSTGSSTVT